jgi:cell division septal protein FtsQ
MHRKAPAYDPVLAALRITVILLFLVLLGVAVAGFLASPRFRVRRLEFVGLRRLKSDQLNWAAGVAVGRNMIALGRSRLERTISRQPGVVSARVVSFSRGTLRVAVQEREPIFWAPSKNGPLFMDAGGYTFQGSESATKGLARLAGIQLAGGSSPSSSPRLASAVDAVVALRKHRLYPSFVKVSDAGGVTAVMEDGVALKLGPAVELEQKCEIIEMAFRALPYRRQIEYIDVSCPQAPAWKRRNTEREQ